MKICAVQQGCGTGSKYKHFKTTECLYFDGFYWQDTTATILPKDKGELYAISSWAFFIYI